ncbi:hypothetical protein PoB_000520200 [Plakobranchus ocellatus]|uniref:Uncharacterized protein n=1 Tax=Plakobranchus ocellatus TaxID=259542 RepID=A0AAV3Y993_9GAST|nr:hypothetical protein PoB_000520200 [Plakobranchus ocellatus]
MPCLRCCCSERDKRTSTSRRLPPYTSVFFKRPPGKLSHSKQKLMNEKIDKYKDGRKKAARDIVAKQSSSTVDTLKSYHTPANSPSSWHKQSPSTSGTLAINDASWTMGKISLLSKRVRALANGNSMRKRLISFGDLPDSHLPSSDIDLILRKQKVSP